MKEKHTQQAIRTARFSVFVNLILALVKGITGYFGNSFALIADAIESITDVFSSTLVMLGLHYAAKPADKNHPYGHGKMEPLVTFIVVVFLLVSAAIIVIQSIHNIQTPHEPPEQYTLPVLLVIIIAKEIFYRIVHRSGKETKSTSLQADAWHHRSDAITSLVAFVGIGLALLLGEGYENADDWAALLAAAFIVYNAYLIFRPALGEVMDEHLEEHNEMIVIIRKLADAEEGILGTGKCLVRKSGMFFHVDLDIIVSGEISVREGHELAHQLVDKVQEAMPEIIDVLVHVEPN